MTICSSLWAALQLEVLVEVTKLYKLVQMVGRDLLTITPMSK